MYNYENKGNGTITMFDKKGKGYCLNPGQTCRIDEEILNVKRYGIERTKLEQNKPVKKKAVKKQEETKEDDLSGSSTTR